MARTAPTTATRAATTLATLEPWTNAALAAPTRSSRAGAGRARAAARAAPTELRLAARAPGATSRRTAGAGHPGGPVPAHEPRGPQGEDHQDDGERHGVHAGPQGAVAEHELQVLGVQEVGPEPAEVQHGQGQGSHAEPAVGEEVQVEHR